MGKFDGIFMGSDRVGERRHRYMVWVFLITLIFSHHVVDLRVYRLMGDG